MRRTLVRQLFRDFVVTVVRHCPEDLVPEMLEQATEISRKIGDLEKLSPAAPPETGDSK